MNEPQRAETHFCGLASGLFVYIVSLADLHSCPGGAEKCIQHLRNLIGEHAKCGFDPVPWARADI